MTKGRPRKLTDEQIQEALRRYRLWSENKPWKIALDLGVDPYTLSKSLKGRA